MGQTPFSHSSAFGHPSKCLHDRIFSEIVSSDDGTRWLSGKVLALRPQVSKPDSTEDPPCMRAPLHAKSYVGDKRPPAGVVWKFGEGVPAQVSSSSSDSGSKLRDPSQNIPFVASKRDANITKLNLYHYISS
ncbi:hypothetical protein AVEN_159060-1 [Araneus ventricosus]|uniref:Uncharacterized protein n=1 Tax=Araneus ventricosus TaxID=182803 RepID=A0A4Y2B7U4_ARAVE|nr:hypothetical protein AVEN_159060-1 [Araneus ventricosus]